MEEPQKGKTMEAIHSFILASVLVLCPTSLPADTSSITADAEQSRSAGTFTAPRMLFESAVVPAVAAEIPLQESSPVTETYVQDENTKSVSAQHADVEEKEAQETVSVESKAVNEQEEEDGPEIADPLVPFNRVMFHVNDKLYFWVLKPVTQVYSHIIPEDFRIVFSNAYDNLKAPVRMLNNLLQLRLKAAGNELIRFLFNSTAGIGGLGDVARDALGIKKQEADFGQTLGHYGVGHGFYIVLPVLGPSSLRDTVGFAGDRLMYPLTYVSKDVLPVEATVGIAAHEKVNDTSFRIGDYESFKESAVEPYVSMRDAFVQHRKKKVEQSDPISKKR
ncbi:MAG: VacJ family lipoprotein [Nitrospirae bacterium CG_4_10_14_0_8_um_filter_41_23]|nr:VacJ family lipoprotein [Nitrospirota bacterium]PIQ93116.1 MAG: VacJ family lipoprotein [Nitrospirae bacterium CG11_big_fil_rev_8_21_14_0_20_41_14]PIV41566.1 MAG: VacJ family lipoprotein [Nitrospirae bacterium CG02_land_8_20_14_3_00_41_53]PIW87868.1 MAG: VacJ family lipoprotein [Nitrospirae bacterium CG_4_8_14_3_um_filter_41_47]PIY87691.1 MAG: VacJ family lipoprotein [Nitrospirae bacterium CG_4_10_14_0_8_um_filter_41_23]PJA80265.1 MAG: VacJ family lipoprotein [Nitrospirae bacterium CG_4_9_1